MKEYGVVLLYTRSTTVGAKRLIQGNITLRNHIAPIFCSSGRRNIHPHNSYETTPQGTRTDVDDVRMYICG